MSDLIVDPKAIVQYAMKMELAQTDTMAPMQSLTMMAPDVGEAFNSFTPAGTLPEAGWMTYAMSDLGTKFQAFLGDVAKGMNAIGNAATVCAYAYDETDYESAEKLNLIGYAYADDYSAQRPDGLPKDVGQTLTAYDMDHPTDSGGLPDVLGNPDSGTSYSPYAGGTITNYPDGSSRTVYNVWDPETNQPSVVTTVMAPGGTMLSTVTVTGTVSDKTRTEVVSGGDPKSTADNSTVKSRTQIAKDGTVTVTTTTTRPEVKDGKVVAGTPVTSVLTYQSGSETGTAQQGPQEELQAGKPGNGSVVDWRKADQQVARQH